MKFIIPGGSGQIGQILRRDFEQSGDDVVVLSRSGNNGSVWWDGTTLGPWASLIDGADVVINLAGRTVNCRYTPENLRQMMDSRIDSTRVVGQAIAAADKPPAVWLQMSTATIYAHRFDAANDEATGIVGGNEPDVPGYWRRSIEIAQAWESTLAEAKTPETRKLALRVAVMMSPGRGGPFDLLSRMTRMRLGGPVGTGRQFVSWIHAADFARVVRFLIDRQDFDGAVNVAAPNPLPQREFMRELRDAWGVRAGLPATRWMAEIGAFFLRSDAELLLKSRRVVPGRLLDAGFEFRFPHWGPAAADLVHGIRQP